MDDKETNPIIPNELIKAHFREKAMGKKLEKRAEEIAKVLCDLNECPIVWGCECCAPAQEAVVTAALIGLKEGLRGTK